MVPEKSELKVREFELYGAYYCGICRSIGARYGQIPRILLSYDSVFLALLLSSVRDEPDVWTRRRCPAHPAKKRNVAETSPEIEYAADMMLLLGYYKLKDDRADEGGPAAFAGERLLRGAYRKICGKIPEKAKKIDGFLSSLHELEKEGCTSFDRAAEPFAMLMEELLDYGEQRPGDGPEKHADALRYAFRKIGRFLGKWIYLIDAFDDVERDLAHGTYNPLLASCGYGQGEHTGETAAAFRARTGERTRLNATLYLSEISEVVRLLPIRKNKEILENIIYLGLLRKTEEIVDAAGRARKG